MELSNRTLNGHDFLPSEVILTPFVATSFGTMTGGGLAFDVKTPFITEDGQEVGTLEGDVGFLALGFNYQQQFGSWFAARFGFEGGARMGVEEQSALAQGVTGNYGLELGGTARILRSNKVILSGTLDFRNTETVGLDPFSYARGVVGGTVSEADLVVEGSVRSSLLGLSCGWAPWDWLGIKGYLEGGTAKAYDNDQEGIYGGGLATGVDFNKLDWIHLGVQLVARTSGTSTFGADLADRSYTYGIGFFYTKWDDFSLSFEATNNSFSRRADGEDFDSFVGTFNLKYWP